MGLNQWKAIVLHLTVRKWEKIKANKTSKISLEFDTIWTCNFFVFKMFFFLKILCGSSSKRHWIIKVDLKYWSYMSVKLPETAFQFFHIFQNSNLLPIAHVWQSAVHIFLVSIIALIKSPFAGTYWFTQLLIWYSSHPQIQTHMPQNWVSFRPDENF